MLLTRGSSSVGFESCGVEKLMDGVDPETPGCGYPTSDVIPSTPSPLSSSNPLASPLDSTPSIPSNFTSPAPSTGPQPEIDLKTSAARKIYDANPFASKIYALSRVHAPSPYSKPYRKPLITGSELEPQKVKDPEEKLLRILNSFALIMASQPGDVAAVSLERTPGGAVLRYCKNGGCTAEENEYVGVVMEKLKGFAGKGMLLLSFFPVIYGRWRVWMC